VPAPLGDPESDLAGEVGTETLLSVVPTRSLDEDTSGRPGSDRGRDPSVDRETEDRGDAERLVEALAVRRLGEKATSTHDS
jgi:hypothetical protein